MEFNEAGEYLDCINELGSEFFIINDEIDLQLIFDVSTEDEYEAFINLYNQIYRER